MQRALFAYSSLMARHPFKTQVSTTVVLMCTGDLISQKFIEKRDRIEPERVGRFCILGAVYVGPVIRTWYQVLDRYTSPNMKYRALKLMLVDQAVFAPVFLFGLLSILGFMHGKNSQEVTDMLKRDYVNVVLSGYILWPAAQIINFRFVPLAYRAVYAAGVSLIWNTYLAWKSNRPVDEK